MYVRNGNAQDRLCVSAVSSVIYTSHFFQFSTRTPEEKKVHQITSQRQFADPKNTGRQSLTSLSKNDSTGTPEEKKVNQITSQRQFKDPKNTGRQSLTS